MIERDILVLAIHEGCQYAYRCPPYYVPVSRLFSFIVPFSKADIHGQTAYLYILIVTIVYMARANERKESVSCVYVSYPLPVFIVLFTKSSLYLLNYCPPLIPILHAQNVSYPSLNLTSYYQNFFSMFSLVFFPTSYSVSPTRTRVLDWHYHPSVRFLYHLLHHHQYALSPDMV